MSQMEEKLRLRKKLIQRVLNRTVFIFSHPHVISNLYGFLNNMLVKAFHAIAMN